MSQTRAVVVTLAEVLTGLLGPGASDEVIPTELGRLGRVLDVDRVYIFENAFDPETGLRITSQRYEWTFDGIRPEINNPNLQNIPFEGFVPRWERELGAGRPVHGAIRTFPEEERPILEAQDIQSLLVVPITVDEEFWGFMGFDACRAVREWTDLEIEALQATAAAFGTSLRARRAEAELRLNAAVFANTQDGVAILDSDLNILRFNSALVGTLGSAANLLVGEPVETLVDDPQFGPVMRGDIERLGHWRGEVRRRGPEEAAYALLSISRVPGDQTGSHRHVAVFTDISRLKATQDRLAYMGLHDALTGLANRSQLEGHLAESMVRAEITSRRVGVLFFDLDHFKTVNDSLGHAPGDEILRAVGDRLTDQIQAGDLVARLGGDEFVVVLNGLESAEDAMHFGRELLAELRRPYQLASGIEVFTSASLGVSIYPDDGRSPELLMQHADAAMYSAKAAGRGLVQRYRSAMTDAARSRLSIETRLRRAIEHGQLETWFQPQFSFETGALIGLEALTRWPQPDGTFVPPNRFIPVAEALGLIEDITVGSLIAASRLSRELEAASGRTMIVAVNLSPILLGRQEPVDFLRRILEEHPFPQGALELELTETALLMNPKRAVQLLEGLRGLGGGLAIDDFGTGYSNLGVLRALPIDTLKIDASLVADIPQDRGAAAIVRTILELARNLGLSTVAEGVQTLEQRDFLKELGTTAWQGYLGSPALTREEILGRIHDWSVPS
jgi:diguanylate cyclase (GGDEF)-like protein